MRGLLRAYVKCCSFGPLSRDVARILCLILLWCDTQNMAHYFRGYGYVFLEVPYDVIRGDGILHAQMAQFNVPYFVCGPFVCLWVSKLFVCFSYWLKHNFIIQHPMIYKYFDCSYN